MNHYQRQFMQYLRGGNWVKITALPHSPIVKAKLVGLGWIERRGSGSEVYYRITESGFAALTELVPLRNKNLRSP